MDSSLFPVCPCFAFWMPIACLSVFCNGFISSSTSGLYFFTVSVFHGLYYSSDTHECAGASGSIPGGGIIFFFTSKIPKALPTPFFFFSFIFIPLSISQYRLGVCFHASTGFLFLLNSMLSASVSSFCFVFMLITVFFMLTWGFVPTRVYLTLFDHKLFFSYTKNTNYL